MNTTGNLWFAFPQIAPPPSGADRVAFLVMAHRGLIELASHDGQPWLAAKATIDGRNAFQDGQVRSIADWIPTCHAESERHQATLTWLTPHDERGWLVRMEITNRGAKPLEAELSFTLRWGRTLVTTYESEPLAGRLCLRPDAWTGNIGLGWVTHRTEFAVALGGSKPRQMKAVVTDPDDNVVWSGDPLQVDVTLLPPDSRLVLDCHRTVSVEPGQTETFEAYLSIAQEAKAACMSALHLAQMGFDRLRATTQSRLETLNSALPETLASDERLSHLVRRNQLFTYFFSLGRTLDTEEICPVTSRSSEYYVSAGYWDRDSLLWSFPTVLRMDREMAAEVLKAAFGRQGRNIGVHSRFIDGAVYEPGFELDELCAPLHAVDRYIQHTGDWTILERIPFDERLEQIERELRSRRHPDVSLFSTDYLPTDDLAQMPYCIYDNVLVWAMCGALERIGHHRADRSMVRQWSTLREEVADAIWQHGVIERKAGRMFAWSVDLQGNHRLYDEPPGSLSLLAWLGFCKADDPVYRNTLHWIYSPSNPHYFPEADEIGCQHEPHPWVLAIANRLLIPSRRGSAVELLRRCPMDNGLACEAIHERTGRVVSGRHFATCAGFLCQALVEAAADGENWPAVTESKRPEIA